MAVGANKRVSKGYYKDLNDVSTVVENKVNKKTSSGKLEYHKKISHLHCDQPLEPFLGFLQDSTIL